MNTMRWMGIASRSTALRSAAWSRSSRTAAKAWAAWALHGGHGASPDLPLLLLELVDHLLHEQRVDPGGDGPKLRLLPGQYLSEPTILGCETAGATWGDRESLRSLCSGAGAEGHDGESDWGAWVCKD